MTSASGTTLPVAGSVMVSIGACESRTTTRLAAAEFPARSTAVATRVDSPSPSGTCGATQVDPESAAATPLTATETRRRSAACPVTCTALVPKSALAAGS